MIFFKQEKVYTCGCACFRMALSHLNITVPSEEDLETEMGCIPESGTHYNNMIDIAKKYKLQCQHGQHGSLDYLDSLIKNGWVVIVAFSCDLPHFAVYTGNNGNHLFLNDPYFGEKTAHLIKKFVNSHWLIDVKLYKVAITEMYLELDPTLNTTKWWIAYKK